MKWRLVSLILHSCTQILVVTIGLNLPGSLCLSSRQAMMVCRVLPKTISSPRMTTLVGPCQLSTLLANPLAVAGDYELYVLGVEKGTYIRDCSDLWARCVWRTEVYKLGRSICI